MACSQRVTPEEEYAGSERPLLPASAVMGEGPEAGPPQEAGPQPPAGEDAIRVTVERATAGAAAAGAVLFVFVRPPGVLEGPPLAVRRIPGPDLPLTLTIGPGDAMIPGTTFPASVVVHGRLDLDGNAMTSGPDDWAAASDPVAPGGEARLVLERPQGP